MSSETEKLLDAEQERQRLIQEMVDEHGPQWADGYAPGSFGCHELLDRTARAADDIEAHLLSHPACLRNPEWFELADRAAAALRDLYQRIGAEHL